MSKDRIILKKDYFNGGKNRNVFPKNNTYAMTHGHAKHGQVSKEYMAWDSMKERCFNPRCPNYKNYGAKGITVCERWLIFENFLEDVGFAPSKKHSLDRFPDQKGNYEPSNVRWATIKQQQRNKSTNKIVEYNGQKKCVADWVEELGLNYDTVINRLYKGRSVEDAFFGEHIECRKPVIKLSMTGEFLEEYQSMKEAARKNNVFNTNISAVIRGTATSCGGFKWALKNKKDE